MPTRITNIIKHNSMIYNLNRHKTEFNQHYERISTGQRFSSISEDPIAGSKRVRLREKIKEITQFTSNSMYTQAHLKNVDGQVSSTIDILQRVRQLSLQAANGVTQGDDSFQLRQVISTEIEELLKTLISIGNQKDIEGNALFGGNLFKDDAFEVITANIESEDGLVIGNRITNVIYKGNISKNLQEIDNNEYMSINIPGNDLFGGTNMTISSTINTNAFTADREQQFKIDGKLIQVSTGDTLPDIIQKINDADIDIEARSLANNFISLSTQKPHQIWLEDVEGGTVLQDLGLLASNPTRESQYADTAQVDGLSVFGVLIKIRNDLENARQSEIGGVDLEFIDSSISNIISQQAALGAKSSRLETHQEYLAWTKTYTQELNASNESTDVAESVMQLKNLEAVHNYALNIGARMSQMTLLDFLR